MNDYETPENHHITTPDGTENPAVMYAFAADPAEPGRFVPDNVFSIPGMVAPVSPTTGASCCRSPDRPFAPARLQRESRRARRYLRSGDEVCLRLDSRNLTEDLVGPPMSNDSTSGESASQAIFDKLCGAGRVYAVQLAAPNGHRFWKGD